MKKLFTIAAVALMTVAGAAQGTESLYAAIEQFPWNCEIAGSVNENVAIKLSGNGSVFNLASEDCPIDLTQYKGVRVEYSNASDEIQLQISQDEVKQEIEMEENVAEATMLFSDDVLALGSLTSLSITTWDLSQYILFKKAWLIKNDDTEVLMTNIPGAGSGANIAIAQPEITFTDVNGRVELVDSKRKSIGIDPEYDEKAYVYTIEFAEATSQPVSVICQNFLGEAWSNDYPAGTTSITFDPANDFEAGAYSNYIYLQVRDENAAYPFSVKVKSMYRTEKNSGGTDGITSVKASYSNDNAVYTISGQRATSNTKGLLIKNNRKYVK